MNSATAAPRSILIVEDWAHHANGHFPRRFAELAEGFVELGFHVEALTSRGWLHDDGTAPFKVHRYGRMARVGDEVARRLQACDGERPMDERARALGRTLRVLAAIGSARAIRHRSRRSVDVIVLSYALDFPLAAIIAGPGRWLFYAFDPPPGLPRRYQHLVDRLDLSVERRRRRRGGGARLATSFEESRRLWTERAPSLEPVVLPIAGCRSCEPIPDARQRLGIASGQRIALMFGTSTDKDLDTVSTAFNDLEEWRLFICGRVAELRGSEPRSARGNEPIVRGGYVSNETRDLAYATADLAILSFPANHQRNSGTLLDAIAWGLPVVCSDDSAAADIVRSYRLGLTFSPGDPRSLADAVRRAPDRIAQQDLDRARDDLSNSAVARRHLEVLQQFDRPGGAKLPQSAQGRPTSSMRSPQWRCP